MNKCYTNASPTDAEYWGKKKPRMIQPFTCIDCEIPHWQTIRLHIIKYFQDKFSLSWPSDNTKALFSSDPAKGGT